MGTQTEKLKIKVEQDGARKTASDIKNIQNQFGQITRAVAGVTAAAVAVKKAFDFAKFAGEIGALRKATESLTRAQGLNAKTMIDQMQKATKGTVREYDLLKQANNALLLGLPVAEKDMGLLAEAGRRLGKAMGVDATQGLESLVVGIGRQSKLWLDNLGIIVDVNKANKDYAKSLGKTSAELTDADKKAAFFNATMIAIKTNLEKLPEDQVDIADKAKQMSVQWDRFKEIIGKIATPVFSNFIKGISLEVHKATELVKNAGKAFDTVFSAIGTKVKETVGFYRELVSGAKEAIELEKGFKPAVFPALPPNLEAIRKSQQDALLAAANQAKEEAKIAEIRKKILESHKQSMLVQEIETQLRIEGLLPLNRQLEVQKEIFEMRKREEQAKEGAKLWVETFEQLKQNIPVGEFEEIKWSLEDATKNVEMGSKSQAVWTINAQRTASYINQISSGLASLTGMIKEKRFSLGGLLGVAGGIASIFNPAIGAGLLGGGRVLGALGAQHGMDSVVTKPTMIVAGEGNRKEHVRITPAPIDTPREQSLVVNLNGDFYGDVDQLADKITERSKLGFNKVAVNA